MGRSSYRHFLVFQGMPKGRKKFVHVNLKDVTEKFAEGEVVSLETLKERRVINPSGREARLPLKV